MTRRCDVKTNDETRAARGRLGEVLRVLPLVSIACVLFPLGYVSSLF
jgi:hypothetical protein